MIFLARHGFHAEVGVVLSGRSEIALSREGLDQARALAGLCLHAGVRSIQSSPRLRARETAEIVGARLGMPVEIMDALDEIDFGNWTGRRFEDLERDALWHSWNSARSVARPPGGEAMITAAQRVVRHLDGLAAAGRSHVLCVGHCDPIRGAIAHYLGLDLDRILGFDIDPGSLSSLAIDACGGRLLRLNEVPA